MHRVVTFTVNLPVEIKSFKLFMEIIESLTAAGKRLFNFLENVLSHNFHEDYATISQNISKRNTNGCSNSEYLYLPHNSKSLTQGKMNCYRCWRPKLLLISLHPFLQKRILMPSNVFTLFVVCYSLNSFGGQKQHLQIIQKSLQKKKFKGHVTEGLSWLSTVYPMALNPTWHVRKNSHRNRKP